MSETELDEQQMAEVRHQLEQRLQQLVDSEPGTPHPRRPRCPSCGAEPERIDWDEPEHGADGITVRMQWLPCGHRFRGISAQGVPPVRPGEETT